MDLSLHLSLALQNMNTSFCSAIIASIFLIVVSISESFFFCWLSCFCSYSTCAFRRVRWVSNSSLQRHRRSSSLSAPHHFSVGDTFRDVLVLLLFVDLCLLFQVLLLILPDVVHANLSAEVSKYRVLNLQNTQKVHTYKLQVFEYVFMEYFLQEEYLKSQN